MKQRTVATIAVVCALGLAAGACGSSSHNSSSPPTTGSTPGITGATNTASASGSNLTVDVESNTLGGPDHAGFQPLPG